MPQFEDIYRVLRQAVLDRYSAQGNGGPATAFVAFEFGTPVPEDTFRLRDTEHTLSPELGVEFVSRQSNMVPDISASMLTRSERTIEGQYGLLLAGATSAPEGSPDFFEAVKSNAVRQFEVETPSLLLQHGKYRPVMATPSNWYDPSKTENWSHIKVDLQDQPASPSPPINPHLLTWSVAPEALRAIISEPVTGTIFQKLREAPLEAGAADTRLGELRHARLDNVFLRAEPAVHSDPSNSGGASRVLAGVRRGRFAHLRTAVGSRMGAEGVAVEPPAVRDPDPEPPHHRHFNPLFADRAVIDFKAITAVAGQDQPVTADQFFLEVDLCLVDIKRPWISDGLMTLPNWYVPGFSQGSFSDATAARNGLMPVLPTACIFIRNLVIRSQWSDKDLEVLEASSSLGSFSMFGRTFDRNTMTLTVPGMQMFAWVCEPLPLLPPSNSPSN